MNNDIKLDQQRLIKIRGNDNWQSVRSQDNFIFDKINEPWGERIIAIPKSQSIYEGLQSSRSIVKDDVESTMSVASDTRLDEIDKFRLNELNSLNVGKVDSFYEIGFRQTKLMSYARNAGCKNVSGCDIVSISVECAKSLGFNDVELCDLNVSTPNVVNADLIVAYHVLEHLSNPSFLCKRLFDKMKNGSYFHVEIPIEPGVPRVKYGHMYAFEHGDLQCMLKEAGFNIVHDTRNKHYSQPLIERCLARKDS